MKNLKFLLTVMFILMANLSVMAQSYKIKGHVYLHDQPLPYASIKNSNTQEIVLADSAGYFEIQVDENDSLICSYIGCSDKVVPVFGKSAINIYLDEKTVNLKDVEIVARKRPIQVSHDGFIINMSAIKKDGKLLSDLLPQLPTVNFNNNNISMAGKSSVLIFLNNHQVYLKGEELTAFLNSLGLENIQRIHVVSTPPAKYDAEENIGILEFETSNKINPGWQTRLLGRASIAHYLTGGASLKVLYSGKNFSIENTILGSYADEYAHSQYTNIFDNYLVSTNCPKESKEKVITTLTTLSLIINSRNNLSATLQLPWLYRERNHDIANDTRYFAVNKADEDSIMSSKGQGYSTNYQTNGEINYAHVFNEKSNFNATLGYINSNIRNYRNWNSKTMASSTILDEDFYSAGHQKYDIYTLKADFNHTFKNWKFNEGYKFSYTNSTSYNEENERLTNDAEPHDLFGYIEMNNALYVSTESSIKPVSFSVGLRVELTQTKGTSYTLNEINRNHYFRLFPVIDMVYPINNNNTLSVNYSGRIKRPDYHLLDPFRWYTSKYDYSEGNPFLKPSYIHNVSISYMSGNSIYTKLYFTKTDNDFGNMVFLDSENIQNQVERAGNFLNTSVFGIDTECNFQTGSWLETNLTGELTYSNYTSNHPAFKDVKGWGCLLSLNNTVFFNKNFSSSLYIEDNLPGYYNYRKCRNSLLLNVGFSYTNNKKNMMISIKAKDLLKNGSSQYSYYSNGIKQIFDNYYDSRLIEITLMMKTGNFFNKMKTDFQSSNSEERNRL